jgi:phosphoglycolate phosphatase
VTCLEFYQNIYYILINYLGAMQNTNPYHKLVLFDIDKTLIQGSKNRRVSFSEAFKRVYGIETDISIVNTHGMTDQQIIFEVLKKKGLSEQTILSKMDECIASMVEHYNSIKDTDEVIILEGVKDLLAALQKKHILLGLVTGNVEPCAHGKLAKVDIDKYFEIGGFGNDDISRTKLVGIAIRRAQERYGFAFDNNVLLVGDAPQDMQAGKVAGVKTIGVTTGVYSREELLRAGADYVLDDLKNTDRFLNTIGL